MSGVKPGDRVRATLRESAVVGEVTYAVSGYVDVRLDGAEESNTLFTPPWTVEVLAPPVPAWMLEPGAKCEDKHGTVWQRGNCDLWYAAGSLGTRTAEGLIAQRGPLTRLVSVPVVPEDVQEAAHRVMRDYDPGVSVRVARWVLDLAGQS